ncbi:MULTISPECIES: radical SAM protein [unclassified Pseudodesulfovibrio]|uniref:radical SAM protein n=1 Tax=unclassified Pseudodesulfovibrio TaxID=2661612 RepID=UPI000FEB6A71|nr:MULTISPECIES: radical SAM protein [unclassified Pseudodesulfovibrio]MCJ2165647.1 radical SAM protein [Pseudodesulfovibrio sp. S3-i]RWU03054.1 radical SAM protein [Pseudodesulfovibrio sp. S3]
MNTALEFSDIPQQASVAIYGHGGLGKHVAALLKEHRPDVRIRCFLDSFESRSDQEIPCWKFLDWPENEARIVDMIIIASAFRYEILSHIVASASGVHGIPVRFVHPEFPFGHDAARYSEQLQGRWMSRNRMPNVLAVTFSTACNFRCTMCMAAKRGMLKKNFIDQMTFDRVIEEYHKAGLEKIGLNGHGESLLHPEFFPLVRQAAEAGLKMSLITNGSLFDEEKIKTLHEQGVHIALSYSGWDKQSYESQYVGGRFDHTSRLIRFMAETLPPNAFTIKSCVLDNEPETADKVQAFFNDCGLDVLSYRISLASSQGETLEFGSLCQASEIHSFKPRMDGKIQPLCKRMLNSWMVLPDGRVTVCGCGPAIQEFIVGNIREQSLEEMGQSPLLAKIIESFLNRETKALGACSRCDKPYHPSFLPPMVDVVY